MPRVGLADAGHASLGSFFRWTVTRANGGADVCSPAALSPKRSGPSSGQAVGQDHLAFAHFPELGQFVGVRSGPVGLLQSLHHVRHAGKARVEEINARRTAAEFFPKMLLGEDLDLVHTQGRQAVIEHVKMIASRDLALFGAQEPLESLERHRRQPETSGLLLLLGQLGAADRISLESTKRQTA